MTDLEAAGRRTTILVFGPGPQPTDAVHLADSEPVVVGVRLVDDGGASSLSVSIEGSTNDVQWLELVDCGTIAEGEETTCDVDSPMPSIRAWLRPNAAAGWTGQVVCAVSLPPDEPPSQQEPRDEVAELLLRFREEHGLLDLLPRGLSAPFPGP